MKLIYKLFLLSSVLFTVSCGKNTSEGYSIVCTVDDALNADSIMIYSYNEYYDAIQLLGSQVLNAQNRTFSINGYTDEPKIAFVKLHNDTLHFKNTFFVVENGKIDIRIGNNFVGINGSKLNDDYYRVFSERCGIINHRKSLRAKYNVLASNGEINDSIDHEFEFADKQFSDSLQRLYARAIKLHPIVAKIVWCQYGNEMNLTPALVEQMKADSMLIKYVK